MTVVKQAIVKTLTPEDDEFEYADDAAEPDHIEREADEVDEAAEPNPFENIQPSDFNDPRLTDAPADPPSDDVPGQNTQK